MESSEEFTYALEVAANYRAESNSEPVTGYLKYCSDKSKTDQHYQNLFNFQLTLILQLIEKVNKLDKKLDILLKEKGIPSTDISGEFDKITEAINKIHITTEQRELLPTKYKFWTYQGKNGEKSGE